jgi:hypothetical protein
MPTPRTRKQTSRPERSDAAESLRAEATAPLESPDRAVDRGGLTFDHQRVSHLAYARFLARGAEHGHDLEDWLLAEQEAAERSKSS